MAKITENKPIADGKSHNMVDIPLSNFPVVNKEPVHIVLANNPAPEREDRGSRNSRKTAIAISSKTLHIQMIEELKTKAVVTQLETHGLL